MDANGDGEGDNDNFDWNTDDENEILDDSSSKSCGLDADGDGEGDNDIFDWNTDDENEILDDASSFATGSRTFFRENVRSSEEASCSRAPSISDRVFHFVQMGFSESMVIRAINENTRKDEASILDVLLTYNALESSLEAKQRVFIEPNPVEFESNWLDTLSCEDNCFEIEELMDDVLENDNRLQLIMEMGYLAEEALEAMKNCGPTAPVTELTDYIYAARMEKELGLPEVSPAADDAISYSSQKVGTDYAAYNKKINVHQTERHIRRCSGRVKNQGDENEMTVNLLNSMTGFGIPEKPCQILERRKLPKIARGPPYFYYENVAFAPKGVWSTMSRFLYDIEPEFVDSLHFCAAARKRGYIHNLPIHNRFPLLPRQPLSIQEALPSTSKWWPSWDPRTKLNCLVTVIGTARLTERIRIRLESSDGEPTPSDKQYVLKECKKWNLIWVGKNKVAPLEPDELERILGYPRYHTRGGVSITERYKVLGNSFQVDTVAYHLSVLKDEFHHGINVLSLFSGIGGAEVALHRLGIPLKNVVSVEVSKFSRNIIRSWWEQTNQKGNLIEIADIQTVNASDIEKWIGSFGGFDLVIGGSPCNNLAGGNRVSRNGLEGQHSSLFYQYVRVLDLVRNMMS